MKEMYERFYELDLVRGIAIFMMIVYHLLWDLTYFDIISIQLFSGFWKVFQVATGTIFISLVGICLVISTNNPWKLFKRGGFIFGLGLIITGITYVIFPEKYIFFGILHFIGISIMLSPPFLNIKQSFQWINLILGIIIIIAGNYLKYHYVNFNYLAWFGFKSLTLQSVDYYPLLPWFGLVLIGIFFGNLMYQGHKRQFTLIAMNELKKISSVFSLLSLSLSFLGKRSLLIYFIHQPILLSIIHVINFS